jgi:hypothetical protein
MEMRFKTILIIIASILLWILVCQCAFAFSCETHQAICQNNYNYNGDCCRADKEYTPAMPYHHCSDNVTDCDARIKASYYNSLEDMNIYYHLIADSESPAHWYSLKSSDHSKFENCVNDYVKSGITPWECSMDFIDNYGTLRHLEITNDLIKPKQTIIENITNTIIEQNHTIIPQQNEEPKISFIDKIINWFKNLFKPQQKVIIPENITNNTIG